ncbi:MAG: hypothetical protein IJY20_05250 [Clostridia bacterium]|nr:hypothetical protein [Clostridia bacterium]
MRKYIAIFLLIGCLFSSLTACAPNEENTHIRFTIKAEATTIGEETLPDVQHEISFPKSVLEKQTVMFAILYACDALGYPYERDGKYYEILVSVAGRANLADSFWVIEATDDEGHVMPITTDDEIDNIVSLSLTYQSLS